MLGLCLHSNAMARTTCDEWYDHYKFHLNVYLLTQGISCLGFEYSPFLLFMAVPAREKKKSKEAYRLYAKCTRDKDEIPKKRSSYLD